MVLSDNVRTPPGLTARLSGYRVETDSAERLRRLRPGGFRDPKDGGGPGGAGPDDGAAARARPGTEDDIDRLTRFYERAPDGIRRGRDSVRRSIGGGRRTHFIEHDGEVAAAALTTAELPGLAMVGGVYALPTAGRTALTHALWAITQALLAESKVVCTVTHDPAVDALCDRLGFEVLGPWRTVHLVRR